MSSGMNSVEPQPNSSKRSRQQRAEDTCEALLNTAIKMFTEQTYDGVSIRALEAAAGVQRGAAVYHYKSKEGLWKAAIDRVLQSLAAHIGPLQSLFEDLDEEARLRAAVAAFVRFSAETPELNRLVIQEGRSDSWRLKYLVDTFIRNRFGWLTEMIGLLKDPHTYYMTVGAATLVFAVEHECKELFGVDPTTDEFIREHATRVADMMLYLRKTNQAESP